MGDYWSVLSNNFPEILSGFLMTCRIVAIAFLIAMGVGVFVGALRAAPSKLLNRIGLVYVEFFRNIPLLVLIYIVFYGVNQAGFLSLNRFVSGALCLGLYTAAYIAEAVRSGVFTVGKGQMDAGLSLGLTQRETLQKIVLPQAVRTVIPPIGNLIIAMTKNSAILGGALGVDDILHRTRQIYNDNFKFAETFLWATIAYLILTVSVTIIVRKLETRLAIRR
jgi:putative glutamine transport system permease protein